MGKVYWFIGLSGSGKTTLSRELYEYFKQQKRNVKLIDGDEMREAIGGTIGYSIEERKRAIKIIIYLAKTLSEHDVDVIVANIGAFEELREYARREIQNYNEIYVQCSLEECARRDVKGYYKKALSGEIKDFIGVDQKFEVPFNSDLVVNTEKSTIEECFAQIKNYISLK